MCLTAKEKEIWNHTQTAVKPATARGAVCPWKTDAE